MVRLSTPRPRAGGHRLGTVRWPPRAFRTTWPAAENYFDVWLPPLAPRAPLIASFFRDKENPIAWKRFASRYKSEMARPDTSRLLDTLAALSHTTDFSVG